MTPKKQLDGLIRSLRKQLPDVEVEIDAPTKPAGRWFLDVTHGKRRVVIEHRLGLGFGLSSAPSQGYGQGPDEFSGDEAWIVERAVEVLRSKSRTKPRRARLLRDLRQGRGVSQVQLAEALGVKQPTISKMERRDDVNLSTLRRFIRAMGGQLEVTARFPNESVEIGVGKKAG